MFFLLLLALNSFLSLMISSAALDKFIKFVRVGQKQETKEREIINTPMDTDEKEKAKTLNSLILNLTCFIIELPSSIVIV